MIDLVSIRNYFLTTKTKNIMKADFKFFHYNKEKDLAKLSNLTEITDIVLYTVKHYKNVILNSDIVTEDTIDYVDDLITNYDSTKEHELYLLFLELLKAGGVYNEVDGDAVEVYALRIKTNGLGWIFYEKNSYTVCDVTIIDGTTVYQNTGHYKFHKTVLPSILLTRDNKKISIEHKTKSRQTSFVYELGRKKALANAMRDIPKDIRTKVWEIYFSRKTGGKKTPVATLKRTNITVSTSNVN